MNDWTHWMFAGYLAVLALMLLLAAAYPQLTNRERKPKQAKRPANVKLVQMPTDWAEHPDWVK